MRLDGETLFLHLKDIVVVLGFYVPLTDKVIRGDLGFKTGEAQDRLYDPWFTKQIA